VFLATDARRYMGQLEMKPPPANYAKFKVMGREFDPAQPEKYLGGFAIRKAA
jgi:nitrate/nitrite transport system substrate-binding protein